MPVRSTDVMNPLALMDNLDGDMPLSSIDLDELSRTTDAESLLSEDIWKKFELDFPELSGFGDVFEEIDEVAKTDVALFPVVNWGDIEIQNHDCMWAGHCGSKEHPTDEPRVSMSCVVTFTPGPMKTPAPIKQENKQPVSCQQSLLKPTIRAAAATAAIPVANSIQTPQTPPMSDDEEVKCKQPTNVLQILKEAISECDFDDDSDLCEYFEDEDLDVDLTDEIKDEPEDVKPNIASVQYAAESDHSYHKDKNASMRTANLGIDTPSDSGISQSSQTGGGKLSSISCNDSSEEEIDVVSVGGEKITLTNRMVSSLPNNPSSRDRQQIQRRMATAITTNQASSGIKTILPVKKLASQETTAAKRKSPEYRGAKRSRQYRITPNKSTPYKRRNAYGNSSESEPEPSEKRSLHNNMERQRRIDLRKAFEELRVLVPDVSKKERAAKVIILREAARYCDDLGSAHRHGIKHIEELKRKQERLRGKLSQLRRCLAAKR